MNLYELNQQKCIRTEPVREPQRSTQVLEKGAQCIRTEPVREPQPVVKVPINALECIRTEPVREPQRSGW